MINSHHAQVSCYLLIMSLYILIHELEWFSKWLFKTYSSFFFIYLLWGYAYSSMSWNVSSTWRSFGCYNLVVTCYVLGWSVFRSGCIHHYVCFYGVVAIKYCVDSHFDVSILIWVDWADSDPLLELFPWNFMIWTVIMFSTVYYI